METKTTVGQAYRDGQLVASEIAFTESGEVRAIPVPIAGSNRQDFKQEVVRGESSIRFVQIDDPALEDELRQLAAGAGDINLRRRQRDEQWAPKPIDLVLDYERNLNDCQLGHPGFGGFRVEEIDFPLSHPAG